MPDSVDRLPLALRLAVARQQLEHDDPRPPPRLPGRPWADLSQPEREHLEHEAERWLQAARAAGLLVLPLHPEHRRNLEALIDPAAGLNDVAAVIAELVDHAQQGVYRPGAWEREWLVQAFGTDWLGNLEPDDVRPDLFQRPKRPATS